MFLSGTVVLVFDVNDFKKIELKDEVYLDFNFLYSLPLEVPAVS